MQYLPDEDERKWLIHYLRRLIERAGWEHFVCAPILEPTRKWFPEPWSATIRDAHIVTQRLLHYANLPGLKADIEGYEEHEDLDTETSDAAGYFSGIQEGIAYFGLRLSTLEDPEIAAGTMAHEVAHAWREQRKLVQKEAQDREELLTDVTTVYLGFGVLTTNDTHRFRTGAAAPGELAWSTSSYGYLPLQAMSFLLGLQLAARGREEEIRAISRELEPNQQRAVRETLALFEDEDVPAMLSLPPRESWPEPRTTPAMVAIYEPNEEEAYEPPFEEEEASPKRNAGRTIYRIRRDGIVMFSFVGAMAGAGIAALVIHFTGWSKWLALAAAIAGALHVLFHKTAFGCTDPECAVVIGPRETVCPGCGGLVGGTVSQKQFRRLAAEQLEREAAEMEFEDCDDCEPERPCAKHALAAHL